jgi:hypothetical protein
LWIDWSLSTDVPDAVDSGAWCFVLEQPYFETRRFTELVQRDGMEMLFQGWSRPLAGFTRPLEDAGLFIEAIREPKSVSADGTVYPFHFWLRAIRPT